MASDYEYYCPNLGILCRNVEIRILNFIYN